VERILFSTFSWYNKILANVRKSILHNSFYYFILSRQFWQAEFEVNPQLINGNIYLHRPHNMGIQFGNWEAFIG